MTGVTTVKIKKEDDGIRLNRWFLKEYPSLSLARLQKLLRTKQIKVDGKKAETSTRLSAGQELRLPPLDEQKALPSTKKMKTSDIEYIQSMVIFKDDDIIALNKPSGLAVQGGTNTKRHIDGMLEALKYDLNEKPRLVHRIDKETSGVLLLARHRKAADQLTRAFREHLIQKTYLVITRGCPLKNEGIINFPLEKVGEKMEIVDDGQKAQTKFRIIDRTGKKYALVEAQPLTGRTHQIRAHMEAINTPILGDGKYYGKERYRPENMADKLYLHAYQVDLSSLYGTRKIIKAELPAYFKETCHILGLELEK